MRDRIARYAVAWAIVALVAALGTTWMVLRPERAWVWAARDELDIGAPLDDSTLMKRRMLVVDGRLKTDEDLSDRTLKRAVDRRQPITEEDLDELRSVLVAVTVIEKGTLLSEALFEPVKLPAKRALKEAITDTAQLDGWAAGVDLEPGQQLTESQREKLVPVWVPTDVVKRGEVISGLVEKRFPASEVEADTILVEAEAVGKRAKQNLLPYEPISMGKVDHEETIYVPRQLIPAGTTISTEAHLKPLKVAASSIQPDTLVGPEGINGMVAAQKLLPEAPIQKDMLQRLPDQEVEIYVPKQLIAAGTTISKTAHLEKVSLQADAVNSDTIVGPAGIDGMVAAQNLLPYSQIGKGMVASPLAVALPVPKRLIPAGAAITDGALMTRTVAASSVQTDTIVSRKGIVGMLAAKNLLPRAQIRRSMVAPPPPVPITHEANLLEIAVSAQGARGGELAPGTVVDVYASARLVIDVDGDPNPLTVAGLETSFPVRDATIRAIVAEGEGYRVTLEIQDDADVAAMVIAAPLVEFYLVEHGGPAG
jgi:flagella basal body P-ring formation protein FlgA